MKITNIYDNRGKTADRYTVVLDQIIDTQNGTPVHACLGMFEKPKHPQGFCQHGECVIGSHLGMEIEVDHLPQECQDVLKEYDYAC